MRRRPWVNRACRAAWLWFSIVGRQWETPGIIPDEYRIHYRMGARLSWQIARSIWLEAR